jgi:two-component sensor histidine kinase/CheY-like chemotaxis protein
VQRYVGNLRGRILALAAAHDNIIDARSGSRSLRTLLDSELQPYLEHGRRAETAGEDVAFTADSYRVIALVVHEMVTNAVKYGAFSARHGRIDVTIGATDDGGCAIRWTESGGPMLSAVSTEGLGTTIIKRLIPHELRGVAVIRLHPAGLRARFVIPAATTTGWNAADTAISMASLKSSGQLAEAISRIRTALVVDDNMLIAMGTETMLKEIGIARIEIASNVADSLCLLDDSTVDIAVLDINLGSETSVLLADALKARGPFIFLTGYSDVDTSLERHADVPSVRKPTYPQALRVAINAVLNV